MARWSRTVLAAALIGAAAVVVVRALAARRSRHDPQVFDTGHLPPVAPARARRGTPADRGRVDTVALDLERLRTSGDSDLEPVVEYLTYIQSQRGEDTGHLTFVRYDDLDAMADREGVDTPAFLERLDQLGVVVSNN
jgi:hypothetical protein